MNAHLSVNDNHVLKKGGFTNSLLKSKRLVNNNCQSKWPMHNCRNTNGRRPPAKR